MAVTSRIAHKVFSRVRNLFSIESIENRAFAGGVFGGISGTAVGAVGFHFDHPKKFNNPLEAGLNYGFILPMYMFGYGFFGAGLFAIAFAAAPITFPCITYGIIRDSQLKKIEK